MSIIRPSNATPSPLDVQSALAFLEDAFLQLTRETGLPSEEQESKQKHAEPSLHLKVIQDAEPDWCGPSGSTDNHF